MDILAKLPNPVSSELRFPFLDLQAEYATMKTDIWSAVDQVLDSQRFIMGPQVSQLETEISALVGCKFAVACASGSDALLLSLMALEIGDGDEVITTPFTFVATAGSISRLKARPVFVDIDPATYNLNAKQLESAITNRTKAIIPVHLFGLPAAMEPISQIAHVHGIPIIEDAAQSIGARYSDSQGQTRSVGNIGDFGCFSFFPSKNLGGSGDGGLITTNNPVYAERLAVLRDHSSRKKYEYDLLGMNSRLDSLQAAILLVKLKHLNTFTRARQRNAERYRKLFAQADLNRWVGLPHVPTGAEHVYNQYVIRAEERDQLRNHLRASGIPAEIYYPFPLHLQPAFEYLNHRAGAFPQAEVACRHVLALPIFPCMTEEQQKMVSDAVTDFFQQKG